MLDSPSELAQGKALLPGEQGLRETEVVGPDLAGWNPNKRAN